MNDNLRIRGFDFHCHLDLHPNPLKIMEQCAHEGIVALSVTTTPKAWPQNCDWALKNKYIHPALGLHPELIGERSSELEILISQIRESRFIGEIGLDGSRKYRKFYGMQKKIFQAILDASQKYGGKVLTIHSRHAASDVIEEIEKRINSYQVLCILHWFSGSLGEAERAVSAGCYFSINHAMLGNENGRKLVQSLPANRLVTETDSPFTKAGNRESLPWDVLNTVSRLSKVRGVSEYQMKCTLKENAIKIFKFAGVEILNEDRVASRTQTKSDNVSYE